MLIKAGQRGVNPLKIRGAWGLGGLGMGPKGAGVRPLSEKSGKREKGEKERKRERERESERDTDRQTDRKIQIQRQTEK